MATTTAPGDGRAGDDDGGVEQAGQDLRRDDPERRAQHAAGQAEHDGLDQELPEDRPRRAPSALRMPISRVRSVTETSMMFMTPMPPTSSDSAAMPVSRTVSVL